MADSEAANMSGFVSGDFAEVSIKGVGETGGEEVGVGVVGESFPVGFVFKMFESDDVV